MLDGEPRSVRQTIDGFGRAVAAFPPSRVAREVRDQIASALAGNRP